MDTYPPSGRVDPGVAETIPSQELFREVNERARTAGNGSQSGALDIFCECIGGCLGRLEVARPDYEDVRRFPTRFIVRVEHAAAATERIVDRRPGFAVVEKVGDGAATAIRMDPRRSRGASGTGRAHEAP